MTATLTPEQAERIRAKADAKLSTTEDLEDYEALQKFRKEVGLTAEQLAKLAGRTVDVVRNVECGRTKLQGELAEALWDAATQAMVAKRQRESRVHIDLAALARLSQTKETLAFENAKLVERVTELERKVLDLQNELAEYNRELARYIIVLRPAVEALEAHAARSVDGGTGEQ